MLRVTPLYGSSLPAARPSTTTIDSDDPPEWLSSPIPSCTLVEYAGMRLLLNAGWDESLPSAGGGDKAGSGNVGAASGGKPAGSTTTTTTGAKTPAGAPVSTTPYVPESVTVAVAPASSSSWVPCAAGAAAIVGVLGIGWAATR